MLLSGVFKRATPENPRFSLLDPNAWDAFGADPASSGIRVGRENAMTYSPWFRAVFLISGHCGTLPLYVKKRKEGGWHNAHKHPAYYLCLRRPNEFQTALHFRQQLTSHALTEGNGYAYVVRRGDGTPQELLPLDPTQTWPVREHNLEMGTSQLWYVLTVNNAQRKIDPENILHIKGLGFDGLRGYSIIDKARESLGGHLAVARSASVFFRNATTPRIVLEVPGVLDQKSKDTLREQWERIQSGIDNFHRTAILDRGMKANAISFNATDAQLIESRKFGPVDVANWTGVPPHKLGDSSRTAYNSLESENQSYLDDCLDYWLVNWEEECGRRLLADSEQGSDGTKDTHRITFGRRRLVRAALQARGAFYVQMLQNGVYNVDEVRHEEDMNPLPDGAGQVYRVALNQGAAKPGAEPPPEGDTDKEKKAAILQDVARRMVRRINTHALRAAKDYRTFDAWVDSWPAEHEQVFREAFAAAEELNGFPPGGAAASVLQTLCNRWMILANTAKASDLETKAAALAAELEAKEWRV